MTSFVTVDEGIVCQQNLAAFDLALILLRVGSNRADAVTAYIERIETILDTAQPGELYIGQPEC